MNASEQNTPGHLPSVSGPLLGPADLSAPPEVEGYEILRVLGEGGMGIVYLARQKHPVQRQVALKIVKPGMDSKQVITRFEAERQALALLDHPNIAQVYDAGTTNDGHPYFSMEYVEGPSVTEHCDKCKLSIEDRLQLFIQICEGVQHAHQKGIIHRDIKPSNILVVTEGDKAIPKIIDFGVAKAFTAPLTEQTFFTEQGQLLGTPEFMSPEQAEMTGHDVDTRSDVYSLGVLLYVLLTGALPFERKELAKAGFEEILRTIREQDPPRPSTRLSGLAEETTQAAANRNTTRGTLTRLVRGDLDWIVMKALEKDRNRRYNTTSELAADIKRHLNNEPVQAGPPTMSYKFCKFIRRHRVATLAALLVAASLVTGTVLATYGLLRAYIERDRAVEAESNAVAQQQEAEKQRNEAENQRKQARLSLYCVDMLMARENWEDGRVAKLEESLDAYRPQPDEQDLRGWEWYYLKALCNQSLLTLRGHKGRVHSVAFSPDGRHLASVGADNTVRIWDWLKAKEICELRGHAGNLHSVAWSPDGQRLASAGNGETIIIWDWTNRKMASTLTGYKGKVHSVTWSPDGKKIASGGDDSKVRIWDVTTGKELHCLSCESRSQSILSVSWSPDGQWLAAGEATKPQEFHATVILWDLTTLKHRHLDDHTGDGDVSSVAWSPDGRFILSTSGRSKIKVWERTNEENKFSIRGHIGEVRAASWSSDGQRFASAGSDRTIKIWNFTTQKILTMLCGHKTPVCSVTWSPNGDRLASGGEDGTIKIWNAKKTGETYRTRRFKNWVSSVRWSPDGRLLATADLTPTVQVWDPDTEQEVFNLQGHTDKIWCVVWSPDGKRLATASKDKTVKIWNATGGSATLTLRGHTDIVFFVAWSPDGKKLASRGYDGKVILWDADTGEVITTLQRKRLFWEHLLTWNPCGLYLAFAKERTQVELWDVSKGETLHVIDAGNAGILSAAWNPDGNQLAIGRSDGMVQVWDIAEKQQVFSVREHVDQVRSVVWSPDGERLASGSTDGTVKIHNATTGEGVLTLRGHEDETFSVAWSPDGKRLASGGWDCTVKIWDASVGYELESGAHVDAIWEAIKSNRLDEATQGMKNLQALSSQADNWKGENIQVVAEALASTYHRRSKDNGQPRNRYARAIEDYRSALHIDPGYLPALTDLAWLLATCPIAEFRDGTEAIKNATRVCELTGWKDYRYLRTLAAAYAEADDYEAAVERQKAAIRLLSDDKRALLQESYEYRLKQYESGKTGEPYHQGIICWWKLDEGSGTKASDSSDHGNHGLLHGSPRWVAGKTGYALRFDGIDGYVDCGNPDVLNFGIVDWTVYAWIKTVQTSEGDEGKGIIFANGGDVGGGIRYALALGERVSGAITLTTDDHSVKCEATSNALVNDDAWHHVVGMRNGTDLLVYIDGELEGCGTIPDGYDLSGTSQHNAYIGAITNNDTGILIKHFQGLIDEVKVYSHALTEQEVRELYESAKSSYAHWESIEAKRQDEATMSIKNFRSSGDRADNGKRVGYMEIYYAMQPPVIDGQVDQIWAVASTQSMIPQGDPADASGIWKALYDSENLYVVVEITDDNLVNDSARSWEDDSVEFYFDGGNTKEGPPLKGDNRQFVFGWTTDEIQGTNIQVAGVEHAQVNIDTGWCVEIKLPWLSLQGAIPQAGDTIGIDCFYNDDDDGGTTRETQIFTFATDANAWNDASQWGTAVLAAIPVTVDPGTDGLVAH